MLQSIEYRPEYYTTYLQTGYRHNYVVNIADVGLYIFGMSMVSLGIVVPAFLLKLGASDMLISFVPAIQTIGITLPQIFSSYHIERIGRVKPLLFWMGIAQRLPWLCTALAIPLLAIDSPRMLVWVFVSLYCLSGLSTGIAKPAWGELIAKAIPQQVRGRCKSQMFLWGSVLGVAGSMYVVLIMERLDISYPLNFSLLFLGAGAAVFLSLFFFSLNREPLVEYARDPAEAGFGAHMRRLWVIYRTDTQFRRYIWVRIGAHSGTMISAFLMVHAMHTLHLSEKVTGRFVLVTTLGGIAASLCVGRVADRFNHKTVLVLMLFSSGLSAVLALAFDSLVAMYASFAFHSVSRTCMMVSEDNIVYEFAPAGKRPSYIGLSNTLSAPFIVLYSIAGGLLARHGYSYPLIAGAAITFLTIPALMAMADPRQCTPSIQSSRKQVI